ncbi:MAG: heat-inducible transcriptional repressor HrcA [Bacillota bacterium]
MDLDDRKLNILKVIINDYIQSAEPIGSRHISKNLEIGLSSATIRNEMADLEEMGFLEQPHTSAGRVPSEKGYRLYVDKLMENIELSQNEISEISRGLEVKINAMNQLIKQASVVVSRITNYPSIAVTASMKKSVFKAVQVVPVEAGKALIIVVTNSSTVNNVLVDIPKNTTPEYIISFSNMLNQQLAGLSINQISPELLLEIDRKRGVPIELVAPILDGIIECISQIDKPEYYLDGSVNIFNHPEFHDISKAQKFLHAMEEHETLKKIVFSEPSGTDLIIKIGEENDIEEMRGCSLLTASYSFGDEVIGTIGVIGPTRMNYSKVATSLNYIRNKMNSEILHLIGK